MNWVKDLRIGKRLVAAFVLVACLTVLVGSIGLYTLQQASARSLAIYKEGLEPTNHMGALVESIQKINITARDLLLTTDNNLNIKYNSIIEDQKKSVGENLKALSHAVPSDLQDQLKSISTQWDTYLPLLKHQVDLAVVNKNDESYAYLLATAGPASAELHKHVAELVKSLEQRSQDVAVSNGKKASRATWFMVGATGFGFVGAVLLGTVLSRQISQPLAAVALAAKGIASGDLNQHISYTAKDEVGEVAEAFRQQIVFLKKTVNEIATTGQQLNETSQTMSSLATQLGSNAEETNSQACVVSAASEQVSKNIQNVATAAEEMSSAVREIAVNATNAAKATEDTVQTVATTRKVVQDLGQASQEIGNVIKLINTIAEQTNLLALNATIEAARAGEAGKGFAVVANEVKELAGQTAKATAEISNQIAAIQKSSSTAVDAIRDIDGAIGKVNEYNATIASAMEEQAATTVEVGRNMGEAAKGSTEIAQNITTVVTAAQSTSQGAGHTKSSASELSQMSQKLQTLVATFKLAKEDTIRGHQAVGVGHASHRLAA